MRGKAIKNACEEVLARGLRIAKSSRIAMRLDFLFLRRDHGVQRDLGVRKGEELPKVYAEKNQDLGRVVTM